MAAEGGAAAAAGEDADVGWRAEDLAPAAAVAAAPTARSEAVAAAAVVHLPPPLPEQPRRPQPLPPWLSQRRPRLSDLEVPTGRERKLW